MIKIECPVCGRQLFDLTEVCCGSNDALSNSKLVRVNSPLEYIEISFVVGNKKYDNTPPNYRSVKNCVNCNNQVGHSEGYNSGCRLYLGGGVESKVCNSWTVMSDEHKKVVRVMTDLSICFRNGKEHCLDLEAQIQILKADLYLCRIERENLRQELKDLKNKIYAMGQEEPLKVLFGLDPAVSEGVIVDYVVSDGVIHTE